MNNVGIVASNTVREILRDRILYGLLLLAVSLVLVSIMMGTLSFAQQEKIITDLGLVAVEFSCCMLAIFVGSSLVFREIEKQTILLLISKPVKRSSFILGKFVGLGTVLIIVDAAISIFLSVICYFYGEVHWLPFFVSQAGILLESLLLLAFALFFGTFARPTLTAIFTFFMWVLGHGMNDLNFFSSKSPSEFTKWFGAAFTRVFPNLEYFDFREAVIYNDPITSHMIGRGVVVWAAWFAILLICTIWIFDRRDFI